MANISKMKLPNNTTYNLKDANAGYSIEIVNGVLGLKNAAGTVISTVTLPSGGDYKVVLDGYYKFGTSIVGSTVDNTAGLKMVVAPPVYNILDKTNATKLIGRIVYFSDRMNINKLTKISKFSIPAGFTLGPGESKCIQFIPSNTIIETTTNYAQRSGSPIACNFGDGAAYGSSTGTYGYDLSLVNDQSYGCVNEPNAVFKIAPSSNLNSDKAYGIQLSTASVYFASGVPFTTKGQYILFVNPTSSSVTIDSASDIIVTANEIPNCSGVSEVIMYNKALTNNAIIPYISEGAEVRWNGTSVGLLQGLMNSRFIKFSRLNNDGSIASTTHWINVSGNMAMMQVRAISGTECNVVEATIAYEQINAPQETFYIKFPDGYTLGGT